MTTLVRLDRSAIVHAHMTAAETASAASHVVRRFPLVVTRHFAARRGSSTLGRLVAPFIRRTMNEQIAISDFVARAIGEPAVTIRNAVPDSEEAFDRERTVLLVQRLETEKHTADALHAWAATTLPSEGWRLQIAGGGSRRDALVSLSRELGVDASVDFLGVRGDVGLLMQRASILVATAPAEPFGLSVVEAMACGLPVIAALGGAHLETVGAVSAHWMYESGHHAELAQKLQIRVGARRLRARAPGAPALPAVDRSARGPARERVQARGSLTC